MGSCLFRIGYCANDEDTLLLLPLISVMRQYATGCLRHKQHIIFMTFSLGSLCLHYITVFSVPLCWSSQCMRALCAGSALEELFGAHQTDVPRLAQTLELEAKLHKPAALIWL